MAERKQANHDFFSEWSPRMAYVLGFFAADGTMTKTKRGGKYIAFHITDKELLEDIRLLMESEHKIAVRVRDPRWKLGYRMQIGSKKLFDDLTSFGFTPNKSNSLNLPNIPQEYFGEYVRGYFDGDGCVYYNEVQFSDRKNKKHVLQVRFTCGDRGYLENFLKIMHVVARLTGGSVFQKHKKQAFELVFSQRDCLALYAFMYNNTQTCGVRLERKFEKFTHAIRIMYKDAVVA